HRATSDRLARLEASDSEIAPHVQILEAATLPQLPWRPLYARDAGISLGAAAALGFLAVWLVGVFSRPGPEPPPRHRRPRLPGGAPGGGRGGGGGPVGGGRRPNRRCSRRRRPDCRRPAPLRGN